MISVIIPYFNEGESIRPLLDRVCNMFHSNQVEDYEILVVDNGSNEEQQRILFGACTDSRFRVLVLSRNFGYQGALWAGLNNAKGDPIVFMDGDGEDPPELIGEFIAKWKQGYDVVYGVRKSRVVSWFMNTCYRLFYRILDRFSEIRIPLDAGEFSLIGGPALQAMREFGDRTRMMRILRAWVGFRQIGVEYAREARIGGQSKFNFFGALRFAWDGFIAATDIPVIFSIYCAMFCFFIGIFGSIYYLLWYFFGNVRIPGFASLNITILFLFSVVFICFNILSRYVMTLLSETRKRPPYLIHGDLRPNSDANLKTEKVRTLN